MATCKDNLQVREKLVELLNDAIEWAGTFDATGTCYSLNFGVVADVLIANGVTVQEWIPVTERLPEEGEDVFVYRGSGYGVEALESISRKYWENDLFCYYPVTHWQPLPQPPKGECSE